jgi:DNA-binding PadR family transcriptional regulator
VRSAIASDWGVQAGDPLGLVEFNVLDAVHRGALRSRRTARQVDSLREQPAGEMVLHDVLRRFEQAGLLSSTRDGAGRLYRLTAAGGARLRSEHRFRAAFDRVLLRGGVQRAKCEGRLALEGSHPHA